LLAEIGLAEVVDLCDAVQPLQCVVLVAAAQACIVACRHLLLKDRPLLRYMLRRLLHVLKQEPPLVLTPGISNT
jgi:hypothetical protein